MNVEHTIEINAPLTRVWEVSIDVENWPLTSPTFQDVKRFGDDKNGPFQLKSQAKILQPGTPWTIWTVTDFEEKKRFAWEGNALYGLLPMRATHELTSITETKTRNILRVESKGIVAFLLKPFITGSIQGAIETENKGLKAFCEESISAAKR